MDGFDVDHSNVIRRMCSGSRAFSLERGSLGEGVVAVLDAAYEPLCGMMQVQLGYVRSYTLSTVMASRQMSTLTD